MSLKECTETNHPPHQQPLICVAIIPEMHPYMTWVKPRMLLESLFDPDPENKLTLEAQGFSVASLHDPEPEQPAHSRDPRFRTRPTAQDRME